MSITLVRDQNHIQNGLMPPQPTRKAMRARLGRVFLSGADGLVITKARDLALPLAIYDRLQPGRLVRVPFSIVLQLLGILF